MTKKIELKKKGWEPDIMTPEEAMAYMDANDIRYEICDTPVPVLSNKVSCGVPADMGDIMIEEFTSLPSSAVRQHFVIDVPARGDSMIEADIHDDGCFSHGFVRDLALEYDVGILGFYIGDDSHKCEEKGNGLDSACRADR